MRKNMTWNTPANPIGWWRNGWQELRLPARMVPSRSIVWQVIFAQWTKLSTCITDQNLSLYVSLVRCLSHRCVAPFVWVLRLQQSAIIVHRSFLQDIWVIRIIGTLYLSPPGDPSIHPNPIRHGATSASDVLFNKVIRHQSESVSREVDSYLTRVWEPWLRELHLVQPSKVDNCQYYSMVRVICRWGKMSTIKDVYH